MCIMYRDAERTGSHVIVGELTHDHEIVRNVRNIFIWDNVGMSNIICNSTLCSSFGLD